MAKRYSDVRRGAELNKALTNYASYLQNASTRPSKRLQGGTVERSIKKKEVSLLPFGVDMSTENPKFRVQATEKGLSTAGNLQTALATRIDVTPDANSIRNRNFTPAKVSYFKPNGTRSYKQSKITKLYYVAYGGETYTAPFGATSATEEFSTGAAAVRADVLELDNTLDYRRVSVSSERLRA